jgi:Mg2+-importing ATPase
VSILLSSWFRQLKKNTKTELSLLVVEEAYTTLGKLLTSLVTRRKGLTAAEARKRLRKYGFNEIAREKTLPWSWQLLKSFHSPFIYLLIGLAIVSYYTGDRHAVLVLMIMVVIAGIVRFWQEYRSNQAAEKLRAMASTTATVSRWNDITNRERRREIPLKNLVPGDIVHLSAGDMVPADVRLLNAKDFFVSQGILTGESAPVQKHDTLGNRVKKIAVNYYQHSEDPLDTPTVCFMGTNVISGTATAVVVATGDLTYLGSLTQHMVGKWTRTSFDAGVNRVSWLLLTFMAVMVPIVFSIGYISTGNWFAAFFFAISIVVGLTPEMLPPIVTGNLARGAMMMAKRKVIVKRLSAIQNLGAINVLCMDKTGTLTQNHIFLEQHLDIYGQESQEPLHYAYLNSYYQTGIKNLLDDAILAHRELAHCLQLERNYHKIAEIPFDFIRRRVSVVVEHEQQHLLICKGAVEEVLFLCNFVQNEGQVVPFSQSLYEKTIKVTHRLNAEGFRVLAVAYKQVSTPKDKYSDRDECHLTLAGYLTFLDPPKDSATEAISALQNYGVAVKVITGDSELIARKICREVGLDVGRVYLGSVVEQMSDEELTAAIEQTNLFAKISPVQKARLIRLLKQKGKTVGYLGDGINDALALRDSDVGISVNTAVDIAKESADVILLEKNLMALEQGILEGRRTFGNIIKYLKMAASSNFGNVFSVVGTSALLPFLPMQPIHLLIQNLLYDISQTTIPFDNVDKEYLAKPQQWSVPDIRRFMLFIGPVSSIFDYVTFAVLWFIIGANTVEQASLFQSGWFIEGLISQTLIVYVIRTAKVPFLQSTATLPVLLTTAIVMAIALLLPFTPLGASVGMVPLPMNYFPWLIVILVSYCFLTQIVKVWYIKIFRRWL